MGRADDLDDWYFGDEKGKPAISRRVYEAKKDRAPDVKPPENWRAAVQEFDVHLDRELTSLAGRMGVSVDQLPEEARRLARIYAESAVGLETYQRPRDFISRWLSQHAPMMDVHDAWALITSELTIGNDDEDFQGNEGWWFDSSSDCLVCSNDQTAKVNLAKFKSRYYKRRKEDPSEEPQIVERRGWKFEEHISDDGLLYNRRIGPVTVSAAAEAGVYQLLESTITGKVTEQSLEAATRHAGALARQSHHIGREEGVVGPVPAWIQREVKAGREPTFERLLRDLPEGVVFREWDDSIIQPTGKPITRGRWRKVVYEAKQRLSRDS